MLSTIYSSLTYSCTLYEHSQKINIYHQLFLLEIANTSVYIHPHDIMYAAIHYYTT